MSLTHLFACLAKKGHDPAALWQSVVETIVKSLYCVQGVIPGHPNAFEVYG